MNYSSAVRIEKYSDDLSFKQYNPTTGEFLCGYPVISNQNLEKEIQENKKSQKVFSKLSFEERGKKIDALGDLLLENLEMLASTMTKELGKPIEQARGEVKKCSLMCKSYSKMVPNHHFDNNLKDVEGMAQLNVNLSPMGTIFQIAPFNYPLWQVIRFCVPTLMGGNSVLYCHSKSTPESADLLSNLFHQAGLPVTNLYLDHEQIKNMIGDPRIRGVAFTGSTRVGKIIAKHCAEHLKRNVLELGGSDPFIVLKDADLDHAVSQAISGRFQNNGQSCIAAKRFIVDEEIHDEFVNKLKASFKNQVIGDPADQQTTLGPLAREDLLDNLKTQVDQIVKEGATLEYQGDIPQKLVKGFFYPPTIITNVTQQMNSFNEEFFGPVAVVVKHQGPDHAVELANAVPYGLGGAVFTSNIELGKSIANELDCGMAFVNGFSRSFATVNVPFGGTKDSGYGKDNDMLEFMNVKTVGVTF